MDIRVQKEARGIRQEPGASWAEFNLPVIFLWGLRAENPIPLSPEKEEGSWREKGELLKDRPSMTESLLKREEDG